MTETTHVQTLCSGCGRVSSLGWDADGLRNATDRACPHCGWVKPGDLIILKAVQLPNEGMVSEDEEPVSARAD